MSSDHMLLCAGAAVGGYALEDYVPEANINGSFAITGINAL